MAGEKLPHKHNRGGLDGGSAPKKCRKQHRCFTALEAELLESLYTEGELHNFLSILKNWVANKLDCNKSSLKIVMAKKS